MKKSELYQELEGIVLTDVARLEIDNLVGMIPDDGEVPIEKVQAVMDIISIEVDAEDTNIQNLDNAIITINKAAADIDTLEKTAIAEMEAQGMQIDAKGAQLEEEVQSLQDVVDQSSNESPMPVSQVGA
ncbi:MAG: hypothetical protein UR96_C0007G0004 [candidate division WS6 bacterium GW2011_GWC1_36_11]|uniref:Uncharacterized protein n=2 Tax=Candidatus Dojkabacteria TaxID=74243 RepID=A0A0G0FZB9_9BACT|nr:MAG: hypothetical protein UR96_C0007G0004 [candidate division WS6 bacterium GW2011_GWC1_36_11]KKQ04114.1 MAG: hypothetical protein US14_C0023G0003 [candidate division WS6 bacterium GW2011_WS6_36_26]KKQ15531.1 MAG: hypothetical protein US29_C0042G0009 [candidate division WS6 bacterium GW2011_GWF1_36_8]HAM37556.1 hypothetical protein [Patescibacteria group bacterium]HAM96531.1 hypothetical protein [Patescibacteria group bacterium]